MSRRVLVGLLRGELGFRGAIVTDALDMKGASGTRSIGEAAVAALAAGADLLCLGAGQDESVLDHVHAAIAGAVADRRLDEVRVAEAADRAARLGAAPPGPPSLGDRDIGRAAASRALRIAGALATPCRGAHVVELRPDPCIAAGEVPWGLGPALQALDPDVTVTAVRPGEGIERALEAASGERPLVVVVRDRECHAWQAGHLERLVAARPDAIVVDMGWPCAPLRAVRTWITTHGASRSSAEAAAELLTRGAPRG
jgi:beta-N-acetylhexosaminidase